MKILAQAQTYERHNATSSGWDIDVRDDGTMRVSSHTRWQGSLDGQVFICQASEEIMKAARGEAGADDPDLAAAVENWLQDNSPHDGKMIRKGQKIQ